MIISHKHKFIFIKTRKTAGTSIEVFLSQQCADDDVITPIQPHVEPHRARNYKGVWNPWPDIQRQNGKGRRRALADFFALQKFYNHISAADVQRRVPTHVWDSYFKFCVERNPWDKTLSHYHNLNKLRGFDITLDDYLDNGDLCVNYPSYCGGSDQPLVDRVLKYENLNDELAKVFQQVGINFDQGLEVRAKGDNRSDRRSYRDVLTGHQRKAIYRIFQYEIDLHGYSW